MAINLVSVAEASADLPGLLARLAPGEEVYIVDGEFIVGRVAGVRVTAPTPTRRVGPGLAKGWLTVVAEDEEHVEHFGETIR